jgi:hypothetical protein
MHAEVGEKFPGPRDAPVVGERVPLLDKSFGMDQMTKPVKRSQSLDGLCKRVSATADR